MRTFFLFTFSKVLPLFSAWDEKKNNEAMSRGHEPYHMVSWVESHSLFSILLWSPMPFLLSLSLSRSLFWQAWPQKERSYQSLFLLNSHPPLRSLSVVSLFSVHNPFLRLPFLVLIEYVSLHSSLLLPSCRFVLHSAPYATDFYSFLSFSLFVPLMLFLFLLFIRLPPFNSFTH